MSIMKILLSNKNYTEPRQKTECSFTFRMYLFKNNKGIVK